MKGYFLFLLPMAAAFLYSAMPASADSPIVIDGASLQVIHTFSGLDGRWPISSLVQDAAGRLYGASRFGGVGDVGTLFSLLPDGSDFRVIRPFTNEFGANGLMLSTNGQLYGTLDRDLAAFELNTDGSGFHILRSVPFSSESRGLIGQLVEGSGGALLGAIEGFGGYGGGGIGRMNKDGTGFTETYHLDHANYLLPPLAAGPVGRFFGVSSPDNQQFGSYPGTAGSFFRVESDGSGFQLLVDLGALHWAPSSPVLAGSDGAFYGIARSEDFSTSIIWHAAADGSDFTILKQFRCADEGLVFGALLEGSDGRLYGTTRFNDGGCTYQYQFLITGIFSINRDGSNYAREWEEVYRSPETSVLPSQRFFLRGRDGALYGSTQIVPGKLVRFQPGNVPTAPVLISCPPDTVATEGSRMVFAPAVRGATPLHYQWSYNGTAINEATNAWLGIEAVQSTSYGTYEVTITNQFGAADCTFVFSAPETLKLSPPHPLPHDMELRVRGSDNLPFAIECSSDLQNWRFLTGGELSDGHAVVSISAASIGDHRFFRARYLPIGLPERD